MCKKYYPAIISPIERITHEFHVSFVIIWWYVGSVIGSFIAIHLHTINRSRRSELVLVATGISFIFCLLIETQLSIDSSVSDYFPIRIVLGALIGLIYLSSIIGCLANNNSNNNNNNLSTAFICVFTIATISTINRTKISTEVYSASLTLLYSLIALNLSSSNWLFPQNDATNCQTNLQASALNLLLVKQTRPLIYLAGAKLMTIFCYFLPFASIVARTTTINNNSNSSIENSSTDEIFADLFILFLMRVALGIITILLVRHNVKYSSIVCLMPLALLLALVLLIPLPDLKHLLKYTLKFRTLMALYVAFSLIVDVISHRVAFTTNEYLGLVPKMISLTFATFIEHLIDVSFVVVYLNDWISAKIIMTSLVILSITLFLYKPTASGEKSNRYTIITF